VAYFHPMVLNI